MLTEAEKKGLRLDVILKHRKVVTERFKSDLKEYYLKVKKFNEQKARFLTKEHMEKNSMVHRMLLHECFFHDVQEFVDNFDN